MRMYRPNARKICRDAIIVVALIWVVLFMRGANVKSNVVMVFILTVGSAIGYVGIMALLPRVIVHESGDVEYRSEFGATIMLKPEHVLKLAMRSGGLERALHIYHSTKDGNVLVTKIRIGYFSNSDLLQLIRLLRSNGKVETNAALEEFESIRS